MRYPPQIKGARKVQEQFDSVRIQIIRPGQKIEPAIVRLPVTRDSARFYPKLREAVEPLVGGRMEHVNVYADFSGGREFCYLDMFVHEEGRLIGLKRNDIATEIYRNNVLIHDPHPPAPDDLEWIAGTAVLFAEKVWF